MCSTSAAPSSLFHVPNGFAYYIAQDIRQMSSEYECETVYVPVCKAEGAPVNHCASTTQGGQKTRNLGQIQRFLKTCDLEIWRMTLNKTNLRDLIAATGLVILLKLD